MFIIWQPWLAHETDHGTHPQHVLFTIVVSKPKPDVRLAVMRGVSGCIYAFPSLGGDQRQSWVTKMVARWGGSRDERSDGGIRAILRQHCTRSSGDLRVIYYIYYRGITGRQEVGFPPRCVWCHHATSTSPRALPRLPARALPGRFRPQYFLTRTGVT
jgi:hypothetical protein